MKPVKSVNRRLKNLVGDRLQNELMIRLSFHWCIFLAINAFALAIWIRMVEMPDAEWSSVLRTGAARYLPCIAVSIVMLPAFLIDSIKLSNRFAGPLYRISDALKTYRATRESVNLKLRKDDYLQDITEDLNAILKDLTDAKLKPPESKADSKENPK
jgi:hypothetical protein